jgi:hypothetical protein
MAAFEHQFQSQEELTDSAFMAVVGVFCTKPYSAVRARGIPLGAGPSPRDQALAHRARHTTTLALPLVQIKSNLIIQLRNELGISQERDKQIKSEGLARHRWAHAGAPCRAR